MNDTVRILGYDVAASDGQECVDAIVAWIRRGQGTRWLACLNPHSYAVARASPGFRAALRDADWLIPDGVGVVLASAMLGRRVPGRVTGADVFHGVSRALNDESAGRVFFIGSTEQTLRAIRERMALDYPRVEVVGTYSPPFKSSYTAAEIDGMVAAINDARPDVLWVGMTAPKQELWIHAVRERLDVRFAAAIGAVFDFYTGRIKRSSPAFQRLGMEWLPRLVQEPRRLWRRTFVSAPIFLRDVLLERLGRPEGHP